MISHWVAHKFGDTSLGEADCYRAVAAILQSERKDAKKAIVVSAMEGVTDTLIELVTLAQTGKESYLSCADALRARHLNTIETLLPCERCQRVIEALDSDFKDIKDPQGYLPQPHLLRPNS